MFRDVFDHKNNILSIFAVLRLFSYLRNDKHKPISVITIIPRETKSVNKGLVD